MLIRNILQKRNLKLFYTLKQKISINYSINHRSLASQPEKLYDEELESISADTKEGIQDEQLQKLDEFQEFLHGFGDDKKDQTKSSPIEEYADTVFEDKTKSDIRDALEIEADDPDYVGKKKTEEELMNEILGLHKSGKIGKPLSSEHPEYRKLREEYEKNKLEIKIPKIQNNNVRKKLDNKEKGLDNYNLENIKNHDISKDWMTEIEKSSRNDMNDFGDLDQYLKERKKEEKAELKRKAEYEKAIEPYPEDVEQFRHLFKEFKQKNEMDGFKSFLETKSKYDQMTEAEKFKELGYIDKEEVDANLEKEIYDEFTETHFSDEKMEQRIERDNIHPKDSQPWNLPDEKSIGAIEQEKYDDLSLARFQDKEDHDFWNQSTTATFEDSGQDVHKAPRYKLWGDEYWLQKPMRDKDDSMKDDITDKRLETIYDLNQQKKVINETEAEAEGMDKSLIGTDGKLPELAIKESGNFENMLDITEEDIKEIEAEANEMGEIGLGYGLTSTMTQNGEKGYEKVRPEEVGGEELKALGNWLYDHIPKKMFVHEHKMDMTPFKGLMREDGYGIYEKFIENPYLKPPTEEKIEEIKKLEGLNDDDDDDREYEEMTRGELKRLADAESRYYDMFQENQNSEENIPNFAIPQKEKIEELKKLNEEKEKPSRLLKQGEAKVESEYDPWMVEQLEKLKRPDGKYDDITNVVLHPKMLEIAYKSLKQRRPSSVPNDVNNAFFEEVSMRLKNFDIPKDEVPMPRPVRPGKGKGARSKKM